MFYTQELLDYKNPDEVKLALKIMYEFQLDPKDPLLEYLYYKEFGPTEKFEEAKRTLETMFGMISDCQKSLKEKLNTLPQIINQITGRVNFLGMPVIVTVGRERRQYKERQL